MRSLSFPVCCLCLAAACLSACAPGTTAASRSTSAVPSAQPTEPVGPTPSAPAPVEEPSVRPGINDPYFEANALDRYSRILEAESREIVQRRADIVDAIGLRRGMVVADIGAGTGLLTFDIAERVGNRGAVFAVDIVPAFLERIRTRVREEGWTNITVVQGQETATGLAPASLDLAFMCDTYHHLEYPQAYMRSVFRTLRPRAVLVLVDIKRIDGQTSAAMLKHVRAEKATVIAEVEEVGFVLESDADLLEENYYLHFRRP